MMVCCRLEAPSLNQCWFSDPDLRAFSQEMRHHLLKQGGCHFSDDIMKWISLSEKVRILIEIPLNFVPRG